MIQVDNGTGNCRLRPKRYGYLTKRGSKCPRSTEVYAKQPFELLFERLETCSTQFLNASVGRLYHAFVPKEITLLMTIMDIEPEDRILPELIMRTIDKASRPEYYAELMKKCQHTPNAIQCAFYPMPWSFARSVPVDMWRYRPV